MKILQTVTLISLLTVGVTSPLLSMEGDPSSVDLTGEVSLLSIRPASPAESPDLNSPPPPKRTFTGIQDQHKKTEVPKAPNPQPSCIRWAVNGTASFAWYLLRLGPVIDGGYCVFSTLRYCLGLEPAAKPIVPKQPIPPTGLPSAQGDDAASLKDLVNSRLNKDLIMCSKSYVFSGESGTFYNPFSQRYIQSKAPVSSVFSSRNNEIMRLTLYEMLEIFLDTTFGLQPGVEGVPPPEQGTGSLGTLLKSKLDFVIGTDRDGQGGKPYGQRKTKNHFSDWEKSTGYFDCGKRIDRAAPLQRPRRLSPPERMEAAAEICSNAEEGRLAPFRIAAGGDVVGFFKAREAATDYERLRALFNIFITAPA